jgi:hypothetical protein
MRKTAVAFAALLALVLGACKGHYTDVSQDPQFAAYLGKTYRTKVDMVVLRLSDRIKELDLEVAGDNLPSLQEIAGKFPYKHGPITIYGVVPAGSAYEVTRAIRSESSTMGHIFFAVKITSAGPFQGQEVRTNPFTTGPVGEGQSSPYVEPLSARK